MTHCATAEQELNLHEELDDGNVEYKLKFDSPTMARVEHLTTQMHFRLNEGHGIAYYQIGVLDSGQVTGLQDNEILETLIILFHMSTTLQYGATLSIEKVRVGVEGFSVMLKVVRTNPAGQSQKTNIMCIFGDSDDEVVPQKQVEEEIKQP